MNTTNELPPPSVEEKIDRLIVLVDDFRVSLEQRMDKVEADARERYVDLRQRISQVEERLTEKIDRLDKRMERVEQRMYALDKNLDTYVREMLYVKDRVGELEETRELRH